MHIVREISLRLSEDAAVIGKYDASAQDMSAEQNVHAPLLTGVTENKIRRVIGHEDPQVARILEIAQKLICALIFFLHFTAKICEFISLVRDCADPDGNTVDHGIFELLIQDDAAGFFDRLPERVFCCAFPVSFHITALLVTIRIVDRRDLGEALDQVLHDHRVFCIRADHVAADQYGVRRSVGDPVRDHAVAALEYIVVKIGQNSKAQPFRTVVLLSRSALFLNMKIVHFRITVGAADQPSYSDTDHENQYYEMKDKPDQSPHHVSILYSRVRILGQVTSGSNQPGTSMPCRDRSI